MKLINRYLVLLASVLALASCVATSDPGAPPREHVSIPFASLHNIRDWQADGNQVLYVQTMHRDWFKITLWSPCFELPFAIGISFVTDIMGSLDEFGSILVRDERCWFQTFEKSEAPPPRDKDKKKAQGKDDKAGDGVDKPKDDKPGV